MSDISTLKNKINTKTLHLFLLGSVTGGLYLHIWLYKTFTALEEVTRIKTMSTTFLVWYLITIGLIGNVSLVNHPVALMVMGVLFLLLSVFTLLWSFRARRVLRAYALAEHNFELRMSLLYTGLFTFYYINYCINALPADKQKHDDRKRPTPHSVQA